MHANERIAVIGLGYVGLTLATVMGEVGFRVVGVEKRKDVVDKTNSGAPHFSETGLEGALRRVISSGNLKAVTEINEEKPCDVYVITVGTPLNAEGLARLDMIESAVNQVVDHMPDGALIILRSTVKIGTTRNVIAPILEKSGKRFEIAMCPERTLEGRALQELRQLPQIVGADDSAVRDRAAAIFRTLTNSIVQVSSLEAAEIVKLVDNTYRDVQFAFANEVARLCEAFEVNAHEVIASGKLGYSRTNVPLPGLVGGPCLEKDPHILAQSAQSRGLNMEITRAGRMVNERQPAETMQLIVAQMARREMGEGVKVALLGMAFKGVPATDDLRGSMSLKVLEALHLLRPDVEVHAYDPVISPTELARDVPGVKPCVSLEAAVRDAAVVIIANNHPALGELPPVALVELMQPGGFVYDYWNHFSNLSDEELGNAYFAVGNIKEKRV
jgi:UDP-N-acetyl-D-mannosaminuronic acid dehydrogenase